MVSNGGLSRLGERATDEFFQVTTADQTPTAKLEGFQPARREKVRTSPTAHRENLANLGDVQDRGRTDANLLENVSGLAWVCETRRSSGNQCFVQGTKLRQDAPTKVGQLRAFFPLA